MRLSVPFLCLLLGLAQIVTADDSPRRADIREIQQTLFTLGFYYTGPIDGHYGPRTEIAIRAFQAAHGATTTGVMTAAQRQIAIEQAGQVTRPRVWPIDEAVLDPSFEQVRSALRSAAEARDARGVAVFFAEGAVLDFGGATGSQELIRRLTASSGSGELWEALTTILAMGAVRTDDNSYCMPYVWCADRVAALVADETSAWVINRAAVLRAAPDYEAEVLELLRYDVLEVLAVAGEWVRVATQAGEIGWIERAMYRTRYDFRMLFDRVDGRWQVTAFVAGD